MFYFIFFKLKNIPTAEEIKLLEVNSAQLELMPETDEFLYSLTRMYRYQGKLECLNFKSKYMIKKDSDENLSTQLEDKLNKCNQFCRNLLDNKKINKLFALILCIGNFMNQNSSRREAFGFSILNLNDLINIKSNDNKNYSLLHYLVQTIKNKVKVRCKIFCVIK